MRARSPFPAVLAAALFAVTGCGSDGGTDSGSAAQVAPSKTAAQVPQALRFTGTTVVCETLAGKPSVLWFWAPWGLKKPLPARQGCEGRRDGPGTPRAVAGRLHRDPCRGIGHRATHHPGRDRLPPRPAWPGTPGSADGALAAMQQVIDAFTRETNANAPSFSPYDGESELLLSTACGQEQPNRRAILHWLPGIDPQPELTAPATTSSPGCCLACPPLPRRHVEGTCRTRLQQVGREPYLTMRGPSRDGLTWERQQSGEQRQSGREEGRGAAQVGPQSLESATSPSRHHRHDLLGGCAPRAAGVRRPL